MDFKKVFIELYKENIKREGSDKLLQYLETKSDFFTAPASTRFHECYEGGLCEHSVKVYYQLLNEMETEIRNGTVTMESVAIIALLHDLCKINFYTVEMRNKKEDGKWVQVPFYTVNDQMPYGHGEKSVMLAREFIKLSLEEMMAIRWHMGGYEPKENYQYSSTAYSEYPLALKAHIADLKATYLK